MRPDESSVTIPIPALLRHARGAYAQSIGQHVAEAGIDDLMANGPYVLGGLTIPVPAGQLIREMGLSATASSHLVGLCCHAGSSSPDRAPSATASSTSS